MKRSCINDQHERIKCQNRGRRYLKITIGEAYSIRESAQHVKANISKWRARQDS